MASPSIDTRMNSAVDERRRSKRASVHWEAKIIRRNGIILPTVTENLSSTGFYFHTPGRLLPGEEFECQIILPRDHVPDVNKQVALLCRGRVARLEAVAGDLYGVGCEIDDYFVVSEYFGFGN